MNCTYCYNVFAATNWAARKIGKAINKRPHLVVESTVPLHRGDKIFIAVGEKCLTLKVVETLIRFQTVEFLDRDIPLKVQMAELRVKVVRIN